LRLKNIFRGLALAFACALFSAATLVPGIASAVNRTIPANTLRATVEPHTTRSLIVNGKEVPLAAGARIFNDSNRTIVPGRVPQGALARIQLNAQGDITAVWLLSAEEAAQAAQ
jgi:hypothetical protein